MNEEEKKAIEILKRDDFMFSMEQQECLDIIINLIKKQQKEIEQLKAHTKVIGRVGGLTSD